MRRSLPLLVLIAVDRGASEELSTGSYVLGTPGTARCPDGFALVVSEAACRTLGVITSSGAARYTGTSEAAGGKFSFTGEYIAPRDASKSLHRRSQEEAQQV